MSNRWPGASSACLVAVLVLTGCSGGDDEPRPTASATSASPTPTEDVQPRGEEGVTYDVLNWSDRSEDPLVLAYKTAGESLAASANRGKLLPSARARTTKDFQRTVSKVLRQAWAGRWSLSPEAKVRIESTKVDGSKGAVVACEWSASTSFRKPGGEFVVKSTGKGWNKMRSTYVRSGSTWRLDSLENVGTCPGGAPR
ncbi:MAG: hypothetical protein PGN07_02075 [Aeromicrobium erythreum]